MTHVPEFSRLFSADRTEDQEITESITANVNECKALAKRFGLQSVDKLTAVLHLCPGEHRKEVEVSGHIKADVVQTCVVTLAPVPAHVEEKFTALFTPTPSSASAKRKKNKGVEDVLEDGPEPFENGQIDLGELTAQHLFLALDPYPRAPGAIFSGQKEDGEDKESGKKESPRNPFAALAQFKTTKK